MYQDFQKQCPQTKFSYYLYREVVAEQNISFSKLGHEECWACEEFNAHTKKNVHQKEHLDMTCSHCSLWKEHHDNYVAARKKYEKKVLILVKHLSIVIF